MHLDILGVKVNNFSKKEILKKVDSFLNSGKFNQIVTVNPEFILGAQKNHEFKSIINNSELSVADGIGIKFAFWRFRKHLKERIAGVDLMFDILDIAKKRNLNVFLVANEKGISSWEETAEVISKIYPSVQIDGININASSCQLDSEDRRKMFALEGFPILFCNFGAPKQEMFIAHLKKNNKHIRVAMGVGGGFDFISGKIHRAPRHIKLFGMEWFWRLFLQPKRYKRTFNAVIIFPIRIILNR